MEVDNNFKLYLPNDYLNNNYNYYYDNNNIIVRTNNNCYMNYNTQYCDCFRVYPQLNYIKSNTFACSSNYSYSLSFNQLSNDFYNSPYIKDVFVLYFIIVFFCMFVLLNMWKVFRKRL